MKCATGWRLRSLAETGNRFLDKLDEKAADDNDELIPVDRR